MIITQETLSTDELLQRRRQIIEQAEDDYDSFIIYSHGAEEKPIIEDLSKSERAAVDLAQRLYDTQVAILRRICGCVDESGTVLPRIKFRSSRSCHLNWSDCCQKVRLFQFRCQKEVNDDGHRYSPCSVSDRTRDL